MLWAIVMAGGSGTRFWPESRRNHPKQFLKIFGDQTLLEQTVLRLGRVIPPSRVIVVVAEKKVKDVRRALKKVPASQILGEPVGRNTAPCAVLAAALAYKKDPKAVIALFPADHKIENEAQFRKTVKAAGAVAADLDLPVTFGVKTQSPHTGYGYLELDKLVKRHSGLPVYRLKQFHEKPALKKAKAFHKNRRFLWNSGMFIWKAECLLDVAKSYLPTAYAISQKILKGSLQKSMRRFFPKMPNISIDYALMEKMRGKILCLPVDFGWNDVGSWESLEDLRKLDKQRNVVVGKTLMIDSSGNIVKSQDRLLVLLGVSDHLVVETQDAVLVCPKSQSQSIRKVVKALDNKTLKRYL